MHFLTEAIAIAVEAHGDQMDRQHRPYILHPLRVMHKVMKHQDDVLSAAAVLHDVIEDCEVEYAEDIRRLMPPRVTFLVETLTHIKSPNWKQMTRAEKDEEYFQYIERVAVQPQSSIIKLADLNDNLFHPARRGGWIGHEQGKDRYLKAYFYITAGHSLR